MKNIESDSFDMTFENRYKVFSLAQKIKHNDTLYEPYKVRGLQEEVLKNSPEYQYPNDREDGYIISQGIDEKGYYAIFLPTENETEKIKAFAKIIDKIEKLAKLGKLQRQRNARRVSLEEMNSIEEEIDELYIDIFDYKKEPELEDLSKIPAFKNKFDKVEEKKVYDYFKARLVVQKYLSEIELNEFLNSAFELKTPPQQKFSFKDIDTKGKITTIFYNYYKEIAKKPYGKQEEYFNLLKNYFKGFENLHINNFSK